MITAATPRAGHARGNAPRPRDQTRVILALYLRKLLAKGFATFALFIEVLHRRWGTYMYCTVLYNRKSFNPLTGVGVSSPLLTRNHVRQDKKLPDGARGALYGCAITARTYSKAGAFGCAASPPSHISDNPAILLSSQLRSYPFAL